MICFRLAWNPARNRLASPQWQRPSWDNLLFPVVISVVVLVVCYSCHHQILCDKRFATMQPPEGRSSDWFRRSERSKADCLWMTSNDGTHRQGLRLSGIWKVNSIIYDRVKVLMLLFSYFFDIARLSHGLTFQNLFLDMQMFSWPVGWFFSGS